MEDQACPKCLQAADRKVALVSAARYPALKGSRLVGSRGVKNLHVCKTCGCLWQTWRDPYYGQWFWRPAGRSIVASFAADSNLSRLIDWIASDYERSLYGVVDKLATLLIRRQPEGIGSGVRALMQSLAELLPPDTVRHMERAEICFQILGLALERSIHGSLRPPGPRVKPPTRFTDSDLERAAQQFDPRELDGLVYLPVTREVLRRWLWEDRYMAGGASSPEQAVIAIEDLGPVIDFLRHLPLDVVEDGNLRGVYAKNAFTAVSRIQMMGRLPENDHAVWMPSASWIELENVLDPLQRLRDSYQRIMRVAVGDPRNRLAQLQMESIVMEEPFKQGARLTQQAAHHLEALAATLQPREQQAHELIQLILKLNQARMC